MDQFEGEEREAHADGGKDAQVKEGLLTKLPGTVNK